jgi:hypothetical protein
MKVNSLLLRVIVEFLHIYYFFSYLSFNDLWEGGRQNELISRKNGRMANYIRSLDIETIIM